jgi:hypothetical protein
MNQKAERMSLILNMRPHTNFCNLFNDDFKLIPNIDNRFYCDICDKGFMYNGNLKKHLASDYHKRRVCDEFYNIELYCNICRKQFTTLRHFDNHSLSIRHKRKLIKKLNK